MLNATAMPNSTPAGNAARVAELECAIAQLLAGIAQQHGPRVLEDSAGFELQCVQQARKALQG